ncbi:MAG TPA: aminotransferase class III-fold pyridoxal phosphate-dependent enzyme, partial [Syntrophorhabdaceae bacterium]|nr:aminotransferase class III-fold pyridoxal phosphate-dependent enzyme [Syntrophorhabdaceae bacterium]
LVKAGSGLVTYGIPDSKGIPGDLAKHTFLAEFNHFDSIEKIVKKSEDIACVIIEPVMGNMGVILPDKQFLEQVRELCTAKGILLIFDEVITGFRIAFGGAQSFYNIKADLTCLGKIIGGGFPIGAFGGRRDIMEQLAPLGPVYQAGTLSGNPVAARAGIHVLKRLREQDGAYDLLCKRGERLKAGIIAIARKHGIPYLINSVTGMFTGFFTRRPVTDYASADSADRKIYAKYFRAMLEEGVFFAPSQFEAAFLTLAHGDTIIDHTLEACERVFARLKR